MKRGRVLKTVVNLLVGIVVLAVLWSGLGFPLPDQWDYRRMERAMLMEPMEILRCGDKGEILSVNEAYLGLYTGHRIGYPMNINEMHLFPLENGAGYAVWKGFFFEVELWAYEETGRAVEARATEKIRLRAFKEDGIFPFSMYRYGEDVNSWKARAMEDMVWREMGEAMQEKSGYRIAITFYDETGTVVALRENGGSYDEN